jgi:hypothetical protein
MGEFTPTEKQEKLFKEVTKAFSKARKAGLVFYGKGDTLVAYKKNADDYIEEDFAISLRGEGGEIEHLSSLKCINDSGADDMGCYITQEDAELYS